MVPEAVSRGIGACRSSASSSDKRPLCLCRRFGTTDCSARSVVSARLPASTPGAAKTRAASRRPGLIRLSCILSLRLQLTCRLRVRCTDDGLYPLPRLLWQLRRLLPFRICRRGPGRTWHPSYQRRPVVLISHAAKPPGSRGQDDAIPG